MWRPRRHGVAGIGSRGRTIFSPTARAGVVAAQVLVAAMKWHHSTGRMREASSISLIVAPIS